MEPWVAEVPDNAKPFSYAGQDFDPGTKFQTDDACQMLGFAQAFQTANPDRGHSDTTPNAWANVQAACPTGTGVSPVPAQRERRATRPPLAAETRRPIRERPRHPGPGSARGHRPRTVRRHRPATSPSAHPRERLTRDWPSRLRRRRRTPPTRLTSSAAHSPCS